MVQKEILTRQMQATVGSDTVKAGVGTLALGKAGDIITRAYGPVVRAAIIDTDTAEFGKFVDGKGILVNTGDCAAIGTQFETVKTLKKGQTGSFLVSGACIVKCNEVSKIAEKMKVQYLDGWSATAGANEVCEIEVNGFDDDDIPSSAK